MTAAERVCAVLAADSKYFFQVRAAIESIRRAAGGPIDIRLIAIGPYPSDQLQWLERAEVSVFDRTGDIPRFGDGPAHGVALTCRPFLPQIFPDADGFVWIDSDVRILSTEGLERWLAEARDPSCPVAAVHESEPMYCINSQPKFARQYHRMVRERLLAVYGQQLADHLEYYKMFNGGVFAMPARSPVWARYAKHLEHALGFPYDHMREQDALNVAIAETAVRPMPSTLNWLCSLAMPVRGPQGRWRTPDGSGRLVDVAHLTNSEVSVTYDGRSMSYYNLYREVGLTD